MIKIVKRKFDKISLIISIVLGIIWGIIGNRIYAAMYGKSWAPLMIGVWFLLLAIILFLVIRFCGIIKKDNLKNKNMAIPTLFMFACVFVAGMLFEILYELGPEEYVAKDPTSYIFLIDDSGSMENSDPRCKRNGAISSVIADCDNGFPVCVYEFSDNCSMLMGMQPAGSIDETEFGFDNYGGTEILASIRHVINDLSSGKLAGGETPRILLFSDGASSHWGMKSVLRMAQRNHVSISTIGFGNADEHYLTKIAESTGGVYVDLKCINYLDTAMLDASQNSAQHSRNLLNYRLVFEHNTLFAIMRIVFVLVLGLSSALLKMMYFCTNELKNKAALISIALSVIGALVIEIGINTIGMSENLVRVLYCVVYMMLFASVETTAFVRESDEWEDSQGENSTDIDEGDGIDINGTDKLGLENNKRGETKGFRVSKKQPSLKDEIDVD